MTFNYKRTFSLGTLTSNLSSVFRFVTFFVSFAVVLVTFCHWLGVTDVVQLTYSRRNQQLAATNTAYSGVVSSIIISHLQTTPPFRRTKTNGPSTGGRKQSNRPSGAIKGVNATTPIPAFEAADNCSAVVPRILHLAWYGSRTRPTFRFHHVISVMSSLRFIQPERIMFWHDRVPRGKWWTFIRQKINKTTTTLMMMQRDAPNTIFGIPVFKDEHRSDIVRLEAVMKYGGIYHDLDVIILRPLGKLYCYNTTMGDELPEWLCNGFFMSVANATFLKLWYDSYHTFDPNHWNRHSVLMPGKIAKEHPGLIHVEHGTIHKPDWGPAGLKQLYGDGVFYNWTARNYAVHLWFRKHNVDYGPQSIKRLKKTVGQIFRFIFYGKSDML